MGDSARQQSLLELVRTCNPTDGILWATMEGTEMTIRRVNFIRSMVLATALVALGAWAASHPAVAEADQHCVKVGGGVLTNLIDAADTLGTATGDLAGGLGITILSAPTTGGPAGVYKVHHHWVTTTGDTLQFQDALLTLYPTGVSNVFLGRYDSGVVFLGGTGKYEHATGTIDTAFGAVDFNQGLLTLRYAGTICFPSD